MNYTLHQLQIFLKVVQTKSVTKREGLHLHTTCCIYTIKKNFKISLSIPLTGNG
jgi:hypothetical protein